MKEVSSMILWEYTHVKTIAGMGGLNLESANSLGSEGWELVAVMVGVPAGIFKRPYKLCSDCNAKLTITASNCSNCGAPVA